MIPFKRIVFPVDYTNICRAIVPYVDGMTRHFSAQLTVVRAYSNTDSLKEVEEREHRQLREFVAEAFPSQYVDVFLEEADPASAIERVAREQEADLVMMATHGIDPVGQLSSGSESVTAKVLHDAGAVLWTHAGRAPLDHPGGVEYKSILCAVEFDEEKEAVLRAASAMASSYHAHLTLVHVVEGAEPDLIRTANDRLASWKQKLGISAPHKILSGTTAAAVRRAAVQEKADLMVVGHGMSQGALTRYLSQLYAIVRESPCPVLSI
jgi:nucleotide-binding universal stress UspA family protein